MNCALIGIYPRCRSCTGSSEPTVHQSQREYGEVPVSLSLSLSLSLVEPPSLCRLWHCSCTSVLANSQSACHHISCHFAPQQLLQRRQQQQHSELYFILLHFHFHFIFVGISIPIATRFNLLNMFLQRKRAALFNFSFHYCVPKSWQSFAAARGVVQQRGGQGGVTTWYTWNHFRSCSTVHDFSQCVCIVLASTLCGAQGHVRKRKRKRKGDRGRERWRQGTDKVILLVICAHNALQLSGEAQHG